MKSNITKVKFLSSNRKHKKGAAIIMVTFFVMMMMIAGIAILHLSYNARVTSVRLSDDLSCKICADAGLEKAIGTMNEQLEAGTLNDDDLPLSIGETLPASDGVFSYKVIKNDEGEYVAYSVAARGNFRRTIMAILDRSTKSYFDYGVLSKGNIVTFSGMNMSAYDSQNPGATDLKVTMGSLGTSYDSVMIKSGCIVDGDVFCGVGGDISTAINVAGTLTGSKYAITEEPEMVMPTMPSTLANKGTDIMTKGSTLTLTPANSGIYNNMYISATGTPGIVVIDGGTVTLGLTGMLNLGNNCEIIVNEGSTLILYADGDIVSGNGASISYNSTTNDATHIQLYGTGTGSQEWTVKSKGDWTGIVYAPNVWVHISAGDYIYGSIVCDQTEFKTNSDFIYDVALQRAQNIALSGPSDFTIKRWSEIGREEIPDWAQ